MNLTWRKKLSDLGRGVGKPHTPLFSPLMYGVSAQIEARSPAEVTADPTRLGKCLGELKRASGTTVLTVAAPTCMEAEALGAQVDRGQWPPRLVSGGEHALLELTEFDDRWKRSDALTASIEVTRRVLAVDNDSVVLPALTGPASLLRQLFGEDRPEAAHWAFAGRALAALARAYCTVGASGLLIIESIPPGEVDGWREALNTLSNIARFHRVPALLAFQGEPAAEWPDSVVPCPAIGQGHERPHGAVLSAAIDQWADQFEGLGPARVMVTAEEIDATVDIEDLLDACELGVEQQGAG